MINSAVQSFRISGKKLRVEFGNNGSIIIGTMGEWISSIHPPKTSNASLQEHILSIQKCVTLSDLKDYVTSHNGNITDVSNRVMELSPCRKKSSLRG